MPTVPHNTKDPEAVGGEDAAAAANIILSLAADGKNPEGAAGENAAAVAHILLSLAADDKDSEGAAREDADPEVVALEEEEMMAAAHALLSLPNSQIWQYHFQYAVAKIIGRNV